MTLRSRANAGLMVTLAVLWLPARIVEEGIHALAALPFADAISVQLRPRDGTAKTVVEFRATAPDWAITAAYVAPEVVATLAGVAVIGWWAVGGAMWVPASTTDWVLLSLLGAQYLAIALPSAADADRTANGGETDGSR